MKRKRALLGSNPPAIAGPKGASMRLGICVPGETCSLRGRFVYSPGEPTVASPVSERFWAFAVVPSNNRLVSSPIDASERWLQKSRGCGGSAPASPLNCALGLKPSASNSARRYASSGRNFLTAGKLMLT